jgi:hypothetical protein
MRIGILTLPLHNNYGGILQAYALKTSLERLGHEVWLVKYNPNGTIPRWKLPFAISKRFIYKHLLKKKVVIFKEKNQRIRNQKIQSFISRNINRQTNALNSNRHLRDLSNYGFDAYVVGSDQVWREKYNRLFIKNYFLDFVNPNEAKKISYAASFGVDTWEYDENTTEDLSLLAKQFTAISVREDSAVELCHKFLDVNVEFHLDPTMLLNSSDYVNLIKDENIISSKSELLIYILDNTKEKESLIRKVADHLKYEVFSIGHKINDAEILKNEDIHPSIEYWLKGFSDAKFVITDSFHGCVFSILFNKPFIVIGNDERGMARFNSLLRLFNLENRLIRDQSSITDELIAKPVNWEDVNLILNNKRAEAFAYFNKSLA